MVKVYLDACCLNRPFDDQTQARIRLEAEAVLLILSRATIGQWQWIGSETLTYEIERTPNLERRRRVQILTAAVHHVVAIEQAEEERAQ